MDYLYFNSKPSHVNAYILKPILALLSKDKNKKILDIGCGNGWLVRELLNRGFDVYGIDASETGIQIANTENKGRFFVQDINSSELPKDIKHIVFDTIISTEVIEHLYSPAEYLKFCRTILQKNKGTLIISTPYHGYLKNLVLAITGKMDAHFTVDWEGGHIKFWSKRTLSNALNKAGFTVRDFIGCGRLPYLWKSMIITAEL